MFSANEQADGEGQIFPKLQVDHVARAVIAKDH
jgi:hypothetical protein